jgi:hypothetical protein
MASAAVTRQKDRREAVLRDRLEARIQFPEESTWVRDMPVAQAFKAALCEALREEEPERLRVRCGVSRDESNALRFMCKVDVAGNHAVDGPAGYAWSWWSPLVAKPEELIAELRRALRLRHERLAAATPQHLLHATDSAGADKARGPAHGTWSTELWDLGRSEQADGFCRNRRGRWTSYAAGSRPLRPRYPR